MSYRNGQQGMGSGLQPINVKLYISLHPDTVKRPPHNQDQWHAPPVEETTKFLGLWWDSHLSFKEHISALKTQCKEALNLIRVVAHLKWGGDRDTLLLLDHGSFQARLWMYCVWQSFQYQFTTTWQHPQRWAKTGTRAFCTSLVSSPGGTLYFG